MKNVLLKFNFQDEDHLDTKFLINILSFCLTVFALSRGIRMHTPILTRAQNGRINH